MTTATAELTQRVMALEVTVAPVSASTLDAVSTTLSGRLGSQAKAAAKDYVKSGSLKLTEQKDLFLYRRVDRREKSESRSGGSSTHTSSSGKTHGGASGSF